METEPFSVGGDCAYKGFPSENRELLQGGFVKYDNFKKKRKTLSPNLTSADDGPHPYYTEQLLDGLKERGVVATFFVIWEHAELHPDAIERMAERLSYNKHNRKKLGNMRISPVMLIFYTRKISGKGG